MSARNERGQAMVLTVVFLVVLLGMCAMVLDVGSWYRADRDTQSTADAAALAGAQALPEDPAKATQLAQQYADKNGGLGSGKIAISSKIVSNDTITVTVKRTAPGFFSKVVGVNGVNVGSTGVARSEGVSSVKYVAPIVVHYKHPLLNCTGPSSNPTCKPDFTQQTTLDLEDLHQKGGGNGSGAFGLLNLNYGDSTGNIGAGTLAGWLTTGYQDYLPTGIYFSAPSANFNNSQFQAALDTVIGKEVLFPVYRLLTGPGSNAKYDIIGWVGFVISSYTANGSSGTITGHFTSYTADGIQQTTGGNPYFGVKKVQLVG
ncbi:MAG TPA: pilus assembly protein TadG-related protein [Gaiellaceae bacterium]|nr:pilus assembly protein TadG-related protein [Gaiellaceae bacterium]